ncbi:hypothetical protein ASPFODRAFT_54290 [Aspergillus luchuensis CBS 106.47]|uniref:Uncharacterized protein n=1 Tax=Aspergillus luchuensis (strain CBS 106.47) TaxID=1137211 RepID=A0A1M3SZM4_ASPLC|nr:hypothetical protein ASPFODRAFT_54290 [Aspergillus luchuensis CBS 106.47]
MVKGISEAIGGLGGFITTGGAYGYLEHQRQGQPIKGRLEVELDNEWKGDYAGE